MSNPFSSLQDKCEMMRLTSTKNAHEAYAQELEKGMNEMIQAIRQAASTANLVAASTMPSDAQDELRRLAQQ